ncbi:MULTISPECIES: dihydroorotase [unclassified Polaribacter]|uniref:dihydroorotase n=1 Tax=unclassified Polaribacter TaxID=196858 RepID=UPI00140C6656|nr:MULTISPECIES: dihydroorotase [unclassified Polaribacter]
MKFNLLFSFLFVFLSSIMYSQNSNSDIKVGDVFVVGEVINNNYKHINFPRANFIIKKGGLANYKNVKGEKVQIKSIKESKNGALIATIELASKKKFFNSHKYIKVNINEAILQKELLKN